MNDEFPADVPIFSDRAEAGRALAVALECERGANPVVVGLARGGMEVAAEVARALAVPIDVVAVRKIGHPFQPEYGIGAVTPGDGVYIRGPNGLTDEQLAAVVEETRAKAVALDRRLHADHPALDIAARNVLIVDDGLATGATMIAALRWAKAAGATRVVAAVPVGARATLELVRPEADDVVCLHALCPFFAVGVWYDSFAPVGDDTVIGILGASRIHAGPLRLGQVGEHIGLGAEALLEIAKQRPDLHSATLRSRPGASSQSEARLDRDGTVTHPGPVPARAPS